jgi:hypothetical protein
LGGGDEQSIGKISREIRDRSGLPNLVSGNGSDHGDQTGNQERAITESSPRQVQPGPQFARLAIPGAQLAGSDAGEDEREDAEGTVRAGVADDPAGGKGADGQTDGVGEEVEAGSRSGRRANDDLGMERESGSTYIYVGRSAKNRAMCLRSRGECCRIARSWRET